MIKLIVGLGNPGKEYEKTRHNVGFMAIDNFTSKRNVKFNKEKFKGIYAEEKIGDDKIIYLKPQKYMNLSGEVVADFVNFFKINKEDILIISDDLNLPFGKIRIRSHGSSGGHNGLKNIELHLSTQNYKRLRVGIGNEFNDMKDFVLGKLNNEEIIKMNETIVNICNILDDYLTHNFEYLMSKYN